jgi:hypothetical protein
VGGKKMKFLMGPGWAKKYEIFHGSGVAKNLKFLMGPGWAKKLEIFDGYGVGKKTRNF